MEFPKEIQNTENDENAQTKKSCMFAGRRPAPALPLLLKLIFGDWPKASTRYSYFFFNEGIAYVLGLSFKYDFNIRLKRAKQKWIEIIWKFTAENRLSTRTTTDYY